MMHKNNDYHHQSNNYPVLRSNLTDLLAVNLGKNNDRGLHRVNPSIVRSCTTLAIQLSKHLGYDVEFNIASDGSVDIVWRNRKSSPYFVLINVNIADENRIVFGGYWEYTKKSEFNQHSVSLVAKQDLYIKTKSDRSQISFQREKFTIADLIDLIVSDKN